uniref:Uncharacterized protein n=1 Tax=Arcella intermedia TaxID=1963864 RepID=A0A6B2L778_9EUKA
MNWLTPKSIFLMTFIKNWVEHVETIFTSPVFISFYKNTAKMINPQKYICWRAIPGYPQILELFLHILRDRPRFGTHFIAACKAMLHSEPLLINYYNRVVLSRTPLFSFSQVSTTLVRIQSWMQEFQKMNKPLTSRFDWKYFCCALDVLISIDHHQVLQKILTLFFEVSDVFTGDLRKTILSDFLFKKYFFRFFLHWDEITRNYFHQFLLWRAIRMKISQLSLPKSFENMSFIGKDLVLKTFQNVDPDIEMNSDLAMLGKIQCYIQVIKEQVKDPLGETYEKSLETYVPRAIAEYEFFVAKYKEWEDKDNKEWRLLPLVFLDAKRRSSLHPNLTSERPT